MSLNKVMLIGNVGKDPEVRYLEGNVKRASFTLATSERFKDRNGEQRENTEWHSVVAWRTTADVIEKYVHKGTPLYVEGKIRTREYTDATGVKKYITEIQADSIQLLGRAAGQEGSNTQPFGAQSAVGTGPGSSNYGTGSASSNYGAGSVSTQTNSGNAYGSGSTVYEPPVGQSSGSNTASQTSAQSGPVASSPAASTYAPPIQSDPMGPIEKEDDLPF